MAVPRAASASASDRFQLASHAPHSLSGMPAAVSAALRAAGMPLSKCGAWLANWNLSEAEADAALGTAIAGIRIVGVQWASPTSNPGTKVPGSNLTLAQAQLDLSVTVPGWFATHTLPPARAEAEAEVSA